jgi:hypothetical protein
MNAKRQSPRITGEQAEPVIFQWIVFSGPRKGVASQFGRQAQVRSVDLVAKRVPVDLDDTARPELATIAEPSIDPEKAQRRSRIKAGARHRRVAPGLHMGLPRDLRAQSAPVVARGNWRIEIISQPAVRELR